MFALDQVLPWGRSFDEYRRMFALIDADLGLKILDCAGGPASFNAEATQLGASVVSVDPLYGFDAQAIRSRIDTTYAQIMDETKRHSHQFVWNSIASVDELGRMRMQAMQKFLDDYETGKR